METLNVNSNSTSEEHMLSKFDESIQSKIMAFLEDPSDKRNAEAALAAVSPSSQETNNNIHLPEPSIKVDSSPQIFSNEYWDIYYEDQGGEPFDWYQDYEQLKPFLLENVNFSDKILMVGCGNSLCSEKMIEDGYKDISNIDISQLVIDQMKERNSAIPSLKYLQMDVRKMDFADKAFDVVIDKGTLDSILSVKGSVANAELMCTEISRILRGGGKFIEITYGDPKRRMMHIEKDKYNWSIETYSLSKKYKTDQYTFIYLITKQKS